MNNPKTIQQYNNTTFNNTALTLSTDKLTKRSA